MTAALLILTTLAAGAPDPAKLAPEIPSAARPAYYPTKFFDLAPDGKTTVSGLQMESHRQFLRFHDLATGAIIRDLPLGTAQLLTSARYSPDGKTLAVSLGPIGGAHLVRLIDAKTGALVREFADFEGKVLVHEFSADGKTFVANHYAGTAIRGISPAVFETWDVATGKRLDTRRRPWDITSDAATPDGKVRVQRKQDGNFIVVREGADLVTLATEKRSYHIWRITPDGRRAVLATEERADVFDTETGEVVRTLATDPQVIASAVVADGGKLLFVAVNIGHQNSTPYHADGGWVHVWDLTKPELRTVIPGLGRDLCKVQPTADGERFVAICGNEWSASKIEVWDTAAKRRLHAFELPKGRHGQAVASPDGNWVAHVSWEKDKPTLQVWNAETGKPAEEVAKAAAPAAGALAFTPDSKRLITVTDGEYAEWDLATGKKAAGWKRGKENPAGRRFGYAKRIVPLPGGGVLTLAPTGNRRQSYVLGLLTERNEWYLNEFLDFASWPVVSPDGRWMSLVGGTHEEQRAFLLRFEIDGSPEVKDKPERYYGPVYDGNKVPAWRHWEVERHSAVVAFAADGKRLYTGGMNHALHVWDSETHKLRATLYVAPPAKPGAAPADWVIVTPGGHFAASPGGEQVLRFRETARTWFGDVRSAGTIPAADVPSRRDPAKVKEALGVK